MKRGTPLARRSRLKAKKPVRARNAKRRATLFAKQFGSADRVRAIKALACYACQRRPAENAHIKSRATGGTFRDVCNLCSECHRTAKDSLHNCGSVEAFEACHPGIDLRARAAFLAEYLRPRGIAPDAPPTESETNPAAPEQHAVPVVQTDTETR